MTAGESCRTRGLVGLFLLLAVVPGRVMASSGPETLEDVAIELRPGARAAADPSARMIGLGEALDIALADNINLALARAEEQAARGRRLAVTGPLVVPSLEFGVGAGRRDGRIQGSFGGLEPHEFSTYQEGVALVYQANIGARVNQAIAERRRVEAATLDSLDTEQRLLLRVAELYGDLMLAGVGVRIAGQLIDSGEQFLGIIKARTTAGLALGSDVARAEAKLAADRQQLIKAGLLLDDTSRRLALTLRLDPATRLEPADARLEPEQFLSPGPEVDSLPGAETRPDVRAARRRADAARNQSQAAWWDLFSPELRAEVRRIQIGDTTDDLKSRSEHRGLLLWTISPEAVGTLRQRRAEREAARLRSVETEDRARSEILEAEQDLEAALQSIPLADRGLQASSDNLRLSEARFKAGTAITLEVLDAQNVLAQARFNLATTIVAYNTAQLRLLAATGRIAREAFASRTDSR